MPTVAVTRAEHLAARVLQAKDDAGIESNAELARRAGLPRRTIVRIVNGQNKARANAETLEALSAATGKPVSFFSDDSSSRVAEAADTLVAALVDELRQRIAESLHALEEAQ